MDPPFYTFLTRHKREGCKIEMCVQGHEAPLFLNTKSAKDELGSISQKCVLLVSLYHTQDFCGFMGFKLLMIGDCMCFHVFFLFS